MSNLAPSPFSEQISFAPLGEPLYGKVGPDEPAFEERVPIDGPIAHTAGPDAEPPTHSTAGLIVPPTYSPPERLTPSEPPDRGVRLGRVIHFAHNFVTEARKALEESIRTVPDGDEVIESLSARGLTPEEAVYATPADEDGVQTTLGAVYYGREQEYAQLQYGEALEASGLEIQDGNDYRIYLIMTNPVSFAAALRTVIPPDEPEQKAGFASQIGTIVEEGLFIAGMAIVNQHEEKAGAMCGPFKYHLPGPDGFPSAEEAFVGNTLPQQAESIAQQLPRLHVSDEIVTQVRTLATAERERLVVEWGVAQKLDILGEPGERIGVKPTKIGHEYNWDPAYTFLRHLQRTAPNAQFTHEVRRTILSDLDAAAGTRLAQTAQEVRERVLQILP